MKFRIAAVAAVAAAIAVPALALYALTTDAAAESAAAIGAAPPSAARAVGASDAAAPADPGRWTLAGSDTGLYRIERSGAAIPLWLDGEVRKILRTASGWFFLTSRGILFSADLALFENRSGGLPVKTYKRFVDGKKSFLTEVMDLKDLEADPSDPRLLAACTKDAVYVSRDAGASWESLGSPNATTGLKAVAIGTPPAATASAPAAGKAVWASHPIKGLFVRDLDGANKAWRSANAGLAAIGGTTHVEEVADAVLAVHMTAGGAPGAAAELWACDSFLPRLYRWDPASSSFTLAWAGPGDFGCLESIDPIAPGSVRLVTEGAVLRFDAGKAEPERDGAAIEVVRAAAAALSGTQLACVSWEEGGARASLSELWLVSFVDRKPYRAVAENRNGFYLMTGFVVNAASRKKYDALMDQRRLDCVVVDVKDDSGRLRFDPRDPAVRKIGKVSSPLDVETFAAEWKAAKGRYLVARIPVFKDGVAYSYAGGKWAAWDSAASAPWRGYYAKEGGERRYIEEYWVDPYCEEAWAYNVAIANEMIARGFDEVQFDYIRFPTDGDNLDQAGYRWRDKGMDKESAITSFMRYARENIAAPISIDIYGANGWYRSGVRTGQDVELLSKYVDVVCPMFYPSHFEQEFMAEPPAELRPYRIYRIGTLRTTAIARKKVAVRPYVQAFYLDVSYDKAYYNLDYVRREVEGVRDATNLGLTFWNNSGRYDDIPVLELAPDGKLAAKAEAASGALLD
jgi:hypothetical protein